MKKRIVLIFTVSVIAWMATGWLKKNISPEANLRYYAGQLEESIHHREQLARDLVESGPLERWLNSPASLETITTLPLFLFRRDSLVAYTDHRIPISGPPPIKDSTGISVLSDGIYLFYRGRRYYQATLYDIVAAIPIYRAYPLKNEHLPAHFPLMPPLPEGVTWSEASGAAPIHSRDGTLLGYLNSEDRLLLPGRAAILTFLLLLGLVGLLISGVMIACRLGAHIGHFPGLCWILGWFMAVSYGMIRFFPIPPPGLLECFYVEVGRFRAGYFLIGSLALYGCWWFTYRCLPGKPAYFNRMGPFLQASVYYILAGLPLLWIAGQIRYGLLNSPESLDFVNFFNLPHTGYLLVAALLLSTIPLSLFSQQMVLHVREMKISDRNRLLASGIGLLPPALGAGWLDLSLLPTVLCALIYIALLDLFADYHRPSLTWLIIWLVFFSGLCAVLFFKFHIDREMRQIARQALSLGAEGVFQKTEEAGEPAPAELQPVLSGLVGPVSKAIISPVSGADRYDYALFQAGRRIDQQGRPNFTWQNSAVPPAPGKIKKRLTSDRIDLMYHHPGGDMVLIGKALGGYATPLALFSFLFVSLLLLVMLLTAGQYFLGKSTLYQTEFGHPSLRYRIQLSFIALIIGAFVLIGMVTASSFKRSAIQQYGDRLSDKLNALVSDFQFRAKNSPLPVAPRLLEELSRIHRIDLAIYDEWGLLQNASVPYLFRTGLLPPRMAPAARRALSGGGQSIRLQAETTGQLDYRMAYISLAGGEQSFRRYLGVPFPSREGILGPDLYAFIGTLINVYVFLLLAASALTIVVANSITRPLDRLGGKLQSIQLGYNEPLEWHSDDEIGQLIQAYNEMIRKLEAATAELRRSEREGAWREMAKQVAHEIKNPLTPMKLSLQHLQRAHRFNPERAAELIDRVGKTLIEQIDGLSRIAGAFSDFAKMPQARHESILLNDLVQSAFQLFRNEIEEEGDFILVLPDTPLKVRADRTQLNRVLNNLLTNGLQAIPTERPPRLSLQLHKQGDKALIQVRDNGSGIPENMQDRVFYPNFTTKSSGMGLGLAMCKNIVEQAGGRIYFETIPETGTSFFVELPLEEMKNPPAPGEPED